MSNKISFESEHKAFSYLFAGLITLCALPVLAWHYLTTLEGFAVLAIGGLLASDAVMWFAAHWSVKTQSAAMRAVSLIVKFMIATVAVCIAAVVILLMRTERQSDHLIEKQTQARTAEIQARASAATQLAGVAGGRSAAREAMKMSEAKDTRSVASQSRADLEAKVPAWVLDVGVYALPPIAAIFGALALTITATIIKRRESEAERQPETQPRISSALPAELSSSQKPVATWKGGVRINPREDLRPN